MFKRIRSTMLDLRQQGNIVLFGIVEQFPHTHVTCTKQVRRHIHVHQQQVQIGLTVKAHFKAKSTLVLTKATSINYTFTSY